MVCFSPVGFDVQLTFRALALRRSRRCFSKFRNNYKAYGKVRAGLGC